MTEIMQFLLPVVGRDTARIRQILRAGSIIAGDFRYRWDSLEATEQDLADLLATFPHAEPSRPFDPEHARTVRFRRGYEMLELSRDSASRKALFARQSFWDGLLITFREHVRYCNYSDADRADVYVLALDVESAGKLKSLLPLLRPPSAAERLELFKPEQIEWLIPR
ncbi:MAG: hypothetical protein HYX72_10260 [Acidobacteria bacterium]|nr:hypothetical protein [Acidobacteriota bacterium]